MNLDNISVNMQNSIRISGDSILYFDAFRIQEESHDADIIFITHEHYDHFDVESIKNIMKPTSIIVAPETMKKKLSEAGFSDESRLVLCSVGEEKEIAGVHIKTVPAYNALKPFHPKHNKWLGYVVTMNDIIYYIAGDTDALKENTSIKCDVAMIPVGGTYTMDKQQAADFVVKLSPKAVIPVHYGEVVGAKEDGANFKALVEAKSTDIQVEIKL